MSDRLRQLAELKKTAEQLTQKVSRAQGHVDVAKKQLKGEFDVGSLKEAKTLLATMEREESTAAGNFDDALETFNEKWGDKLKG